MGTPLTADQLVAALRAEGCRVVEYKDWRTHNRNHKGAWGPVNGVILHHTGGYSSGAVEYCYSGSSDLPGPLCGGVITKDGTVYLVGNGRTNHAGGGDPDVLAEVAAESYGTRPQAPNVGNSDGVDGNRRFYGFECVNLGDGKDPWPDAQVDAMVRASAALVRAHGWGYRSVIGHKEWSDDKSDPRGPGDVVEMPRLRAKIGQRLAHPASWNGEPTPLPEGPDMTVKPDRQQLWITTPQQLIPGVPKTLYWTTEYQDDGNEHGAGGKTVADNVTYSSVMSLALTGLATGEFVEVYAIEEDAAGQLLGQGPLTDVDGRTNNSVDRTVPFIGIVGQRLAFQIVNRGAAMVTLDSARLSSWFWPNA